MVNNASEAIRIAAAVAVQAQIGRRNQAPRQSLKLRRFSFLRMESSVPCAAIDSSATVAAWLVASR